MNRDRPSLARFSRYLPDAAKRTAVASGEPLTRQSVTMFADIAGFTALSERLARFGTAGTEQVGDILRETIGGALDIVAGWGGDALAFGGDAITVEFPATESVWEDAQAAAAEIVALFESVAGTDTLAGPVEVTVRIGISGGRVTSLLCPGRLRDVLVQLGPGLDRAADASAMAARNGMVIDDDWYTATGSVAIASGVRGTGHGVAQVAGPVPVWAPRLFHPLTASRIASAAEPPDEHRRMTCAFLSLPPTDDQDSVAVASLTDFVSRAADLMAEAGGDVVQCSGGDKGIVLYAVFGAPLAHPDDPLRAVHAVDQIRTATQQSFSAGISTGLAFTAVFGGQQRGFPSAIGDTTNVAARLMSAAEPGSTLLDGPTATSAGERLTTDEPRAMSVKNRDEPIEAFRFRELSRSYLELDDEAATPLVGRETELTAGERLLDVAAHAGGVLHLSGEAGSGKSRLAAEIARRARIRGLVVRTSAFEAFGVSRPFGPFADFVRERPGLPTIVTDHDLATAIAAVRPGDENLAPLLGSLLGLEEQESAATVGLSADQRSELGRRLLVDLLCASATPTLLVLEDLHWADEASLRLLADLAVRLPLTPVSMLTTRRPMHVPGCVPVLELGDLAPDRLATIVRDTWSRLGGGDLPNDYVQTLVARAAGSPLFAQTVTELARRSYRPGVPLPEVPLPDELLPFLTSQIDTLGDSAQATALRAAILGRPVSGGELADVFGEDAVEIQKDLARLSKSGIVRQRGSEADPSVVLRHATVAEALVERASHAVRAPLHERVCRHLIESHASAREIASHLEHCDIPDLELPCYRSARREASEAWALNEARRWAELALAAAPSDESGPDALALAELEQQLGDLSLANDRLAGIEGAHAEQLRGRIALETGRPVEAVAHLQRAKQLGAQGAGVTWPLTMALCELGQFAEAHELSLRQLRTASSDDGPGRLDALANLGVIHARQGEFEGAASRLEEACTLARQLGDVMRLAIATGDLAGALYLLGRTAEAAAMLGEAAELAERLGSKRWVAMTLANAAAVRWAAGDHAGAERAAVASSVAALEIGDLASSMGCLQVPLDVAEAEGRLAEAAGWWLQHALLEQRLGRPPDSVVSWFRHASALAALGDLVAAQAAIDRTEPAASELDDETVKVEHDRARAAVTGRYTPPMGADESPIELPPLDASLPEVTAADVDDLFARIDAVLTEREAQSG